MRSLTGLITLVLACAIAAIRPATADGGPQLRTVVALAYSSDGNLLAAGDDTRELAVFRTGTGEALPQFATRELPNRILAVRFAPDGLRLLVATASGLHLFDIRSGTEKPPIQFSAPAAALSPDGRLVAFPAGNDVQVLDAATGKRVATLRTGLGFPATLAFSPDSRLLAVGAQETIVTLGAPAPEGVPSKDLKLFDLKSGTRRVFKALSPWVSVICYSLDLSEIAAITFDHAAGAPINEDSDTALNVWWWHAYLGVIRCAPIFWPARPDAGRGAHYARRSSGPRAEQVLRPYWRLIPTAYR